MTLGADLVFRRTAEPDEHTVHPYIHLFSHQRSVGRMTRAVTFPDVVPQIRRPRDAEGRAGKGMGRAASGGGGEGAGGEPAPAVERTPSGKLKAAPAEAENSAAEDDEAVDLRFVQGDFLVSLFVSQPQASCCTELTACPRRPSSRTDPRMTRS